MIAMLLAALASQAAVNDDAKTIALRGRCEYPQAAARYQNETALILCDSITISREGSPTVDFRQRSWGSIMRFEGEMSGDRMAVNRLYPRHHAPMDADGTCEIFRRDGEISGVTCLVRTRSSSAAANFVTSRI